MLFLEKAFLPVFLFFATISGLAFGSIIPILFLILPVLAMPVLMYFYTQVYKEKYKTLADDQPFDFSQLTSNSNVTVKGGNMTDLQLNKSIIIQEDASANAQAQIADITARQLPELIDAMPANGSATQQFTALGVDRWVYRFHFKSVSAEFNAIGIGHEPSEAFAVARQVLEKQIREWHVARDRDEEYLGQANTEILKNFRQIQQQPSIRTVSDVEHKEKPTVLIVEDDMDVASATASIFKQLGCKTIISDGHDGASHKMSFQDVDFIVLDWMLGDNLSADELVKKSTRIIDAFTDLRNKFQLHHAKVITYSALDRSKVQLPETKYFDHLDHWQKPVNYNELARRASDMLVANGY
ncbi:MAG: hypothetical protein A2622_12515 [Bdellovibrionales bacterium RIFCSPHIGHO2_01_FULL_40_29]|nr:MAG: hypothetical protein A2622_12515 [Bdellovibrionales bacterium RIFCSPHIGHO2_01_FULL_40_29]OFZ33007.1 MAG: hypothetical protein A3D17_09825 [Bdellovibrionales bacterium RIFCSPHIGHO2_02_FULL_40_15]